MNNKLGLDDNYWNLIREAISIKYLIYMNGGNASKSAVEDVLMKRLGTGRYNAHQVMNIIEFYNLDASCIVNKRWTYTNWENPVMRNYPEILETSTIKWYRGKPEIF